MINFFMALKYGIRAFKRTWTRKKIFKTRFSMLCWSLKVRLIFRPFWLIFGQKNQKWQKYPPQNTLKSPILSKFQIGPDFSIFIVWSCYYARWKAQTWYFSVVPGPDTTKILSFRQKAKTSARKCIFGHFSHFYPKINQHLLKIFRKFKKTKIRHYLATFVVF